MSSALVVVVAALAVLSATAECAEKVQLALYSEALCNGCIYYANSALNKAMNEVGEIFSLNYVPWGNAVLTWDKKIECQHGVEECVLNSVEACVHYYYPTEDMWWPFLHCVDISQYPDTKIAKKCAEKLSYNWTTIDECANGDLGYKLDIMYYHETAALNPPHTYVPWVTVDGKHEPRAEGEDVIEIICNTYRGSDKPKACNSTVAL